MTIPKPVKGRIQDSGGGQFTVWVDRDTESYPLEGTNGEWTARVEDDPQAHIDQLVERGVLEDSHVSIGGRRQYGVVVNPPPPHDHRWHVESLRNLTARIVCSNPRATNPNRGMVSCPSTFDVGLEFLMSGEYSGPVPDDLK
jgi:hypothetical protein